LRADAPMHGRAKALFLADFTNGAAHERTLLLPLWHLRTSG
jgi:hypothetical protein